MSLSAERISGSLIGDIVCVCVCARVCQVGHVEANPGAPALVRANLLATEPHIAAAVRVHLPCISRHGRGGGKW